MLPIVLLATEKGNAYQLFSDRFVSRPPHRPHPGPQHLGRAEALDRLRGLITVFSEG